MSDGADLGQLALLLNAAATLYMTGLVWFVQHVHYPLLAEVGSEAFVAYEQAHVARTGPVVGPVMVLEAGSALLLLLARPESVSAGLAWLGVALVAVIWASTWGLQVPRHRVLSRGFDRAAQRALVGTNWIRTVAWSLRSLLVLVLLWP